MHRLKTRSLSDRGRMSFLRGDPPMYKEIEVDYLDQNFKNILRRNGFESLEGLRGYPKKHFIKFSNMGQATLQELYQI
jgi:DNA-directed RNA polymerase alpha subunit